MRRKTEGLLALLRNKQDKLDWDNFSFLENLLVFCVMRERTVPRESGVRFGITMGQEDESVCLLFQTDRSKDPLIRNTAVARPDYLVLYGNSDTLILTIVEMKGKTLRSREHGIDQLRALRDLLASQISEHLPTKMRSRLKIQGILLTSFAQHVPLAAIAKEKHRGFDIFPLQYHHKAELFPYVSRENGPAHSRQRERYKHQTAIRGRALNFIEECLATRALPKRINDNFLQSDFAPGKQRTGLYINYLLSDSGDYVALKTNTFRATIAFKDREKKLETLKVGLRSLGIEDRFVYRVID